MSEMEVRSKVAVSMRAQVATPSTATVSRSDSNSTLAKQVEGGDSSMSVIAQRTSFESPRVPVN